MKSLLRFGLRACGSKGGQFNLLAASVRGSRERAAASSSLLTALGQVRASAFPSTSRSQAASESSSVSGWTQLAKVDMILNGTMWLSSQLSEAEAGSLELENTLDYVVRPFISANNKKAREDICAGCVQSPTTKGSLSSQACLKVLRYATDIPHYECDSACQCMWAQVSPISSEHHFSAKWLLYFLSSVPYCGRYLDDGYQAHANQTSVGICHRSLGAVTAAHPEQTQNSTVIQGFPNAHTCLLNSNSGWGEIHRYVPCFLLCLALWESVFAYWKSEIQPGVWQGCKATGNTELLWVYAASSFQETFCSGLIYIQVSVREISSWTWHCHSSPLILVLTMQDFKEMIKSSKSLIFSVKGLSLVDTGFDAVRRQTHTPHTSFHPHHITGLKEICDCSFVKTLGLLYHQPHCSLIGVILIWFRVPQFILVTGSFKEAGKSWNGGTWFTRAPLLNFGPCVSEAHLNFGVLLTPTLSKSKPCGSQGLKCLLSLYIFLSYLSGHCKCWSLEQPMHPSSG